MSRQIFPGEIIENTQESNFSRHSVKSLGIYTLLLFSTAGLMGMLPFLEVDVGIRATGIIRPVTEITQITTPVSGIIEAIDVRENSRIGKGKLIAAIAAPQITERIRHNKNRQARITGFLHDLKLLLTADSIRIVTLTGFKSSRFRQSYNEFVQLLSNQKKEKEQHKRHLDRQLLLYENDFTSRAQTEEATFAYEEAVDRYNLIIEQHRNRWELDKINFQAELEELESELEQLQHEHELYKIRSPVSGTVQSTSGLLPGIIVGANQVIGEISPDTTLIAELYISPGEIGLLREEMPVRLQIDAYNYNQWGTLNAVVVDISSDVIMQNDRPYFRVRCSPDRTYLQLSNGVRGQLRKGMTLQARFIVTRRTLFQLLFDKVDDWLNPIRGEKKVANWNYNP
jgi:membrane fusion protein, peptide pheromone/bacteriocin exporter